MVIHGTITVDSTLSKVRLLLQPQTQMSKKDIEELLKKGAYGAIMDDDNVADQFCEEDIDQILQRRTQVIKIESEGKGSTFSKVWNILVMAPRIKG